jgi:hypothetical protein
MWLSLQKYIQIWSTQEDNKESFWKLCVQFAASHFWTRSRELHKLRGIWFMHENSVVRCANGTNLVFYKLWTFA